MARGESPAGTQAAQTLLVVDDEKNLRLGLSEWARDVGFLPVEAASGREALEAVREQTVDVVLLDLRLQNEDGLDVLKRLREEEPSLPVIMLTGHGSVEHAVQATKLGAYDFMLKPPNHEHLEVVLRRALEHARLKREVEHWRGAGAGPPAMVGESSGLRRILGRVDKAAKSESATVLIQGETGSGKELIARYLHAKSARGGGPFIELNCSAIPEQLLESELYGNEKGAFTDAKRSRKGLVELADGGTLFLDEIGEMAPGLQAKLLRVLETHTFRRVGGGADITVDVRVVAATHRDLKRAVAEGRFREDLFFRLNVVPIDVPPLRERVEDVSALAEHFIARFCGELGRATVRLDPAALQAMQAYPWPGNVRELRNVIERVVLLEAEDAILPEHLPAEILRHRAVGSSSEAVAQPFPPGVVRPLADLEKMAIEHALSVCGGNKTRAAQALGISRQTLRTKLKDYALGDDASDDIDAEAATP
jgi:two-component system, NtrC family, response regulator AtoC